MPRRFAKVSEEEIKTTLFYPSDLVNTKTTISLRVGEERWIYTSTLRASVCIHHYSPPLRGIVVYYGIPEINVESTDTREDADVLSFNFVLKLKDISRSHRIIVIVCLVTFHAPLAN